VQLNNGMLQVIDALASAGERELGCFVFLLCVPSAEADFIAETVSRTPDSVRWPSTKPYDRARPGVTPWR
jgi:hypothetical protein